MGDGALLATGTKVAALGQSCLYCTAQSSQGKHNAAGVVGRFGDGFAGIVNVPFDGKSRGQKFKWVMS